MHRSLIFLGLGLILFSVPPYYAEHKLRRAQEFEAISSIDEVLKSQSQALASSIVDSLSKADRDASAVIQRWKKKGKTLSFQTDTTLTEPDAPQWIYVGGRRLRAAGTLDNALLEDALEAHLKSFDRISLYQNKGKYFMFIRGTVGDQEFSAAYNPEKFFSSFRSLGGIRAWVALKDGTVLYHPLHRFIGSRAGNLKPIAAGIKEMSQGGASSFSRRYLGLDGRETTGAWSILPSHGLMVGSEWPKAPKFFVYFSSFFWIGSALSFFGALTIGLSFSRSAPAKPNLEVFEEGRLDDDALEYLENVRASAQKAYDLVAIKEQEAIQLTDNLELALIREKELEKRLELFQRFQEKILPLAPGRKVWSEICELVGKDCPGLLLAVYRYSPSSFSLVPESIHGGQFLPQEMRSYWKETRIFLGSPRYLQNIQTTEAFQKWDARRKKLHAQETEFRFYTIQGGHHQGMVVASFEKGLGKYEFDASLSSLEDLIKKTASFCDSLPHLLQSMDANGSGKKAVAGEANYPGNRPRPS